MDPWMIAVIGLAVLLVYRRLGRARRQERAARSWIRQEQRRARSRR